MNSLPEAERYTVFLNPYPDHRFTRCPRCGANTHQRNRALIVQLGIDMMVPALTPCRYCSNCDLLIVHRDELEAALRDMLPPEEASATEGTLGIVGTLDRGSLGRGEIEEVTPNDLLEAFRPIRDLVHFEQVHDDAGNVEWVEMEQPYPDMAEIPVPEVADVSALPQVEEEWQIGARRLQSWITGEEEPYRPYGILVVSTAGPLVIFHDIMRRKPTPDHIRDTLLKAMSHPTMGGGDPRRPSVVVTEDESLAEPLKFELNALDVRCTVGPTPELDDALGELEYYMAGGHEPIPGLLDNPRVKPKQVGELFEAAAEFYDLAPWEWMLDEDLIALRYPVPNGEWRFASVMGYAGMEFGLAVFEDLFDYDALATTPPGAAIGMMDYHSLMFDDITVMPFSDIEAVERYGWEVAGDDAYPIPLIFTRDEAVERPGPEEIEWYTVALRAITTFFDEYWPDDVNYVPEPVSTTYTVPVAGRQVKVEVRYPADLALDEE